MKRVVLYEWLEIIRREMVSFGTRTLNAKVSGQQNTQFFDGPLTRCLGQPFSSPVMRRG